MYKNKDDIENLFGRELIWKRLHDKKMSRVVTKLQGMSVYNRKDWDNMMDFLTEGMINMEKAFRKYLDNYKN